MKLNTRTLVIALMTVGLGIFILFLYLLIRPKPTSSLPNSPAETSNFGSYIGPQSQIVSPDDFRVLQATPSGQILPYSSLFITFSQEPTLGNCNLSSLQFSPTDYSLTVEARNLIITPHVNWPSGETIQFLLVCPNLKQTIFYQVKNIALTTEQERFQIEAHSQQQTGQGRQAYLKERPYVQSFPLDRGSYFMMYIESSDYIYVVSNDGTPFTEEQKKQIETKERDALKKLGVPVTVPFVFQKTQ